MSKNQGQANTTLTERLAAWLAAQRRQGIATATLETVGDYL